MERSLSKNNPGIVHKIGWVRTLLANRHHTSVSQRIPQVYPAEVSAFNYENHSQRSVAVRSVFIEKPNEPQYEPAGLLRPIQNDFSRQALLHRFETLFKLGIVKPMSNHGRNI